MSQVLSSKSPQLSVELRATIRRCQRWRTTHSPLGTRGFEVRMTECGHYFELADKPFSVFGTMKQDYRFEVADKLTAAQHSAPHRNCRFVFFRLDTRNDRGFYDWSLIVYGNSGNNRKCVWSGDTTALLTGAAHLGLYIFPYVYRADSVGALATEHFVAFLIGQQTTLFRAGYSRCNPCGFMVELYDTLNVNDHIDGVACAAVAYSHCIHCRHIDSNRFHNDHCIHCSKLYSRH